MTTTIDAGSAKLAGLQIDTLTKVRQGHITLAQWERFNNLSAEDREMMFGRKLPKVELTRSWCEEDGVIYFSVTSDGSTGEQWISHLERHGDYAKQVLRSKDFKPTNGVTTEVAVLKGMLFSDNDRITSNIRAEADKRKFKKPNAELACLIRVKFTDDEIKAMGLTWIVAMHEPIKDSDGDPHLLGVNRGGEGRWLSACSDWPDRRWDRELGFAFAVSQVSA